MDVFIPIIIKIILQNQNKTTKPTKPNTTQNKKNKTEQVRANHPTNKPQNDTKNKKTTPPSRIAIFW